MARVDVRLLSADKAAVTRAELIEGVLQSAVRNEAALAEGELTLTDGLSVPPGAAESSLAIRVGMTTGTYKHDRQKYDVNRGKKTAGVVVTVWVRAKLHRIAGLDDRSSTLLYWPASKIAT